MALDLLLIFVFLFANGIFAGSEIAVLSVRKTRVRELARRRDKRALAVEKLRGNPEQFLATVQIMITIFSTAAGAVGGANLADDVTPMMVAIGFDRYAEVAALAVVVGGVVLIELVLGELVPKSLALRYAAGYSMFVARPLLVLSKIMRPLVWILAATSNLVLKLFGDSTSFTESRLSRDELQQLVEEAAKTGSIDPRASEIASHALEYGEVTVAEVMIQREKIVALRKGAPTEELQRVILEEGHSRMPVYEGELDNIVGYVVARDVLAFAWERELIVLDDILRPPYRVQYGARALDCLREMQRSHNQLGIVIDEAGGVIGLVTIEDLVEELVGDIFSEDDVPSPLVIREPEGTALVPGWAPVRKVNRDLQLDLPVGRDRATIAGLCISLALAIPQAGQRLVVPDGTVLEIVDASARRVRRVRVHPVVKRDGDDDEHRVS